MRLFDTVLHALDVYGDNLPSPMFYVEGSDLIHVLESDGSLILIEDEIDPAASKNAYCDSIYDPSVNDDDWQYG